MNGTSIELSGQRFGPLVRPVGNDDAVCATAEQRSSGLLARISRADDHDVPAFECAENPLCEFHGHRTDRHAAALDFGLSANLLGDVERLLKGPVQLVASGAPRRIDVPTAPPTCPIL